MEICLNITLIFFLVLKYWYNFVNYKTFSVLIDKIEVFYSFTVLFLKV